MPNLDKTGPQGQGPQTGRRLGPCDGGAGRGWRCWGGRGFGRFFSSKNELTALKEEEKMLEEELKAVKEEKESLKGDK